MAQQAAAIADVSVSTIKKLVWQGRIPDAAYFPGPIRLHREAFRAWAPAGGTGSSDANC